LLQIRPAEAASKAGASDRIREPADHDLFDDRGGRG
jgi:hypothetical protein